MTERLRKLVHDALDRAVLNGYDQTFDPLDSVCEDLTEFDAGLEHYEPHELRQHVQEWQIMRFAQLKEQEKTDEQEAFGRAKS